VKSARNYEESLGSAVTDRSKQPLQAESHNSDLREEKKLRMSREIRSDYGMKGA